MPPKQERFPEFVKDHTYRILITAAGNQTPTGSGSGFFISKDRFVTCFHVAFGGELRFLENTVAAESGANLHEKLETFYKKNAPKTEIELPNGAKLPAKLSSFNEIYDAAVFEVAAGAEAVNVCSLELNPSLSYGDKIAFGGFSDQYGYKHYETPFAYNEGIVSSFPTTTVAGGNYEHIRINSINLNGNSGAPLFLAGENKIIGMINGNMNWGRDDLLAVSPNPGNPLPIRVTNRVPLSIAYATKLKTLKEAGLI